MHRLLFSIACVALVSCASADHTASLPRDPAIESAPVETMAAVVPTRLTWSSLDAMTWPEPQSHFRQYNAAVRRALWEGVYSSGGTELYCRARFTGAEARDQMVNDIELQLEHVYPADSIADVFGYTNRSCRTRNPGVTAAEANQPYCKGAASDLYNLFPSYAPMNQSRGNLAYGELEGQGTTSARYRDICSDFERGRDGEETYVEPDDDARGDIARAILYMHYVYDLPFEPVIADRDLLLTWANADPVDTAETRREERIRQLQPGSWNPLVLPRSAGS